MNNGRNVMGGISCLVSVLIMVIVLRFFFRYFWIIIPILLVLNLIRGWCWRRRIKKAQQQVDDFVGTEKSKQNENYCEAEFEIIDDDAEE